MKPLKVAAVVLGSLAVAGAAAPAFAAEGSPLGQVTEKVGGLTSATKALPLDGATTSGLGGVTDLGAGLPIGK
ncbi:hypothetical protein [Streptomyces sp. NPDC051909]|uniref:hypothetical protein n=1 Tax=Streptomyces sp. NPDC051909 TaxID=3154944 RepID=UPI0034159B85